MSLAGVTEGLWWEIETVVKTANTSAAAEKLLTLVPADQNKIKDFREQAKKIFPYDLPEMDSSSSDASICGFIYFDQNWAPHYTKLTWNNWLLSIAPRPLSRVFEFSLKSVSQKCGRYLLPE